MGPAPFCVNHNFLGQTWKLIHGRPSIIGPLINPGFYRWVQTELLADVMERVDDNMNFLPDSSVPSDLHWLTAFVNDTMMDINPVTDSDSRAIRHFYIALEQEFDCQETNCAFHTTWYFHFRRVNLEDETVQSSYDFGCLELDAEAWIKSFLELRFPNIEFDYDSLLLGETLPHLRIHHTF